jgi:hypothetical protein
MTGFINAAREAKESGTFTYLDTTINSSEMIRFFPD